MPRRQFEEWLDFFDLCPPPSEAIDIAGGIIGSTIANVNRDPETKAEPHTVAEFMRAALLGEGDQTDHRTSAEINEIVRTAKAQAQAVKRGNHNRPSGA